MRKQTVTHEISGGFCTKCGDTEEWLRANGQLVVDADAPKVGPYAPETLHFKQTGLWAGVTRKDGNGRRTDICRHGHKSEAAAMRCAERLSGLRNAR